MIQGFISYSHADTEFATRLAEALPGVGITPWIDRDGIQGGARWSTAIQDALDAAEVLILVLSPDAMASTNVEDEWQYALDQGIPVVPVRYRPTKVHFQLGRLQYVDFHDQPFDAAIPVLVAGVRSAIGAANGAEGEDAAPAVTPVALPSAPRHNLPHPTTALVGRETALADLAVALTEHRIVTLTGAGGSGKTRLALQAATDGLDDFADGAWFADLSALEDDAQVAGAVALAVGLRESGAQGMRDVLLEHVASRALLLVLDNCEHVVAGVAALAEDLLRAAPNARVLATSREPLRIHGERVMPVPPLSLPDPADAADPARVADHAAVRLFTDRAREVKPGFELDESNALDVVQLVRRLDGIPLAIELAAARVRMMAPSAILQRLDQRFKLLTGGSRTAHGRQRTLEGAVDWSHDLLEPAERQVFRRLAVFRGGWTLEDAEVVAADDSLESWEVLDLLAGLVDKSLVEVEERATGQRYRYLETIRHYAAQKLDDSPDVEDTVRRHVACVVAHVQNHATEQGRAEVDELIRWAADEHENIRAAFRRSAESGDAASGRALAEGLGWAFYARGLLAEGRELLEGVLAIPGAADGSKDHAVVLFHLGTLANHQGDHASARHLMEEAMGIFAALGDDDKVARVQINLGITEILCGELVAAQERLESARAVMGDTYTILSNLGMVAERSGESELAIERFKAALELARSGGKAWEIGHAAGNLGSLLRLAGRLSEARALLEESLAAKRGLDAAPMMVFALTHLGHVAIDEEAVDEAFAHLAEATRLANTIGEPAHLVELAYAAARLARLVSSAEHVAELLGAGDQLRQGLGTPESAANVGERERVEGWARAQRGESDYEADYARGARAGLVTVESAMTAMAELSATGSDYGPNTQAR